MEPDVAISMLKGEAANLDSNFHIKYNMLINSLRMEEINPEDIIKQSFYQF
jgi:ATP-dependent RNA helicase DOB1